MKLNLSEQEIIKEYKRGDSLEKISKKYKCSVYVVVSKLNKNKVKRRPKGFQKGHPRYEGVLFKKGQIPWNKDIDREEFLKHFKNGKMPHAGKRIPKTSREKHYNWKGGKYFDGRYIYILNPKHPRAKKDGYVAKHVLVMEEKLGRHLKKGEVVHHIDENRVNNNPKNLKLFKSQKEHFKFHKDKKWKK